MLVQQGLVPDTNEVNVVQIVPEKCWAGEAFIVQLKVNKGTINSFAKIQQTLPEGMVASELDANSAKFIFDDHTVKFIWDKLPDEKEFSVSYKITPDHDLAGNQTIEGVFDYLEGTDRMEKPISPATILLLAKTIALEDEKYKPATKYPEKESIEYRIQIAASVKGISIKALSQKYNLSQSVKSEKHKGLIKYTVGSYSTYNQAKKDLAIILSNGVPGAFITAYKNNERIEVKEVINLTK